MHSVSLSLRALSDGSFHICLKLKFSKKNIFFKKTRPKKMTYISRPGTDPGIWGSQPLEQGQKKFYEQLYKTRSSKPFKLWHRKITICTKFVLKKKSFVKRNKAKKQLISRVMLTITTHFSSTLFLLYFLQKQRVHFCDVPFSFCSICSPVLTSNRYSVY